MSDPIPLVNCVSEDGTTWRLALDRVGGFIELQYRSDVLPGPASWSNAGRRCKPFEAGVTSPRSDSVVILDEARAMAQLRKLIKDVGARPRPESVLEFCEKLDAMTSENNMPRNAARKLREAWHLMEDLAKAVRELSGRVDLRKGQMVSLDDIDAHNRRAGWLATIAKRVAAFPSMAPVSHPPATRSHAGDAFTNVYLSTPFEGVKRDYQTATQDLAVEIATFHFKELCRPRGDPFDQFLPSPLKEWRPEGWVVRAIVDALGRARRPPITRERAGEILRGALARSGRDDAIHPWMVAAIIEAST
jgi:hypothetical protein